MISIKEFSKGVFILEFEDEDLLAQPALIKLICPKPFKYRYLEDGLEYSEKYFKDSFKLIENNLPDLFKNVKVLTEEFEIPDKLYEIKNYWEFISSKVLSEYLDMKYEDKEMTRVVSLPGLNFYVTLNKGSLKVQSNFQFYGIRHPMLKWYLELYEKYIKLSNNGND